MQAAIDIQATDGAVRIGRVAVGGRRPVLIAGPCAVEPDYVETALALQALGVDLMRGCIHKPRTRPESFQGMGEAGIELLAEAKVRTGIPVVTEVMAPEDIPAVQGIADCLQIGSRNMQNFRLLVAAGESGLPVLLKRGFSATYDEWLAAASYIERTGNRQVILCERGIRTFETRTRNTLDLSAIPVLRELTDLPIIVDPSHAAGTAAWVPALAKAALAVGADGLMVEAHPRPRESWCDAEQAISLSALASMVSWCREGEVIGGGARRLSESGR
jgi:3-deoxy-7-phosphoheptulonate synthase